MKLLACYDSKNYSDTTKLLEKTNLRGIVLVDGKLAMQRDKDGVYKIPGGGMEPGESQIETLARELREEVGLVLVEDSLVELGEITEIRRDIFEEDTKYISHSLLIQIQGLEKTLGLKETQRS